MQDRGASTAELGFVEMQALVERLREENHQLGCRNLVLQEQCRHWKSSSVETEDLIVKLREKVASLKSKDERLMERARKQTEEFESEERRWSEEMQMIREKCLQLDVGKRKLELDLDYAKKELKKMEAAMADVDKKDRRITSLLEKSEGLQMENRKIEEEWRGRILKLKKDFTEWLGNCSTSSEAKVDRDNSGPKSIVVSHLESPNEMFEAGMQSKAKPVSSEDLNGTKIHDGTKYSPAVASQNRPKSVAVSHLESPKEKHEAGMHSKAKPVSSKDSNGIKIHDGTKYSPGVASSSTVGTLKSVKFAQGRELGAVNCSIEMQGRMKRCKYNGVTDGKLWKSPSKMFTAFTANDELCTKSVCALYRKHLSLGAWKNALTQYGNRGFKPDFETRGIALGKLLSDGDPEGKMKKTVDEVQREDPSSLKDCYDISRHHFAELFEIYNNDLDPLFSF